MAARFSVRVALLALCLAALASAEVAFTMVPMGDDPSDALLLMPTTLMSKTCISSGDALRCSGDLAPVSFSGESTISFAFQPSKDASAPLFNFATANKGAKIEARLVASGQSCPGLAQDIYGDQLAVSISPVEEVSGSATINTDDSFVVIDNAADGCTITARVVIEGTVLSSWQQVALSANVDTTNAASGLMTFSYNTEDKMHILNFHDPTVPVTFKVHQNFGGQQCHEAQPPTLTVTDQSTEELTATQPRIVGGSNARRNQYPSLVSIQSRGSHFCGGTLISPTWVLSAAHCFSRPAIRTVVIGAHRIQDRFENGRETIRVAQIINHPRYSRVPATRNDVALVRLERPARSTSFARLDFALANTASFSRDGINAVVAGWGRLSERGASANALQHVTVPVVPHNRCLRAYPGRIIQDEMLCAGFTAGGRDACQGDSGGPLFNGANPDIQIGVVSWGMGCARPGRYGVYARLRHYSSFVRQHVTNLPTHRALRSMPDSNLDTSERYLLPGTYDVTASAPGCNTASAETRVEQATTQVLNLNCVCPEPQSVVDAQPVETVVESDNSGAQTSNNNTGKIVGGVLGGIVGAVAIVAVVVFARRRRPAPAVMRSSLMPQDRAAL